MSGRRTARSNGVGVRLSRPVLALFGGAVLVWLAGLIWFAGTIPNDVVDPYSPADAIVVLTGGSQRFETGLDLLAAGKGKQLFISGVHQGVTVADLMHQAHRAPDRPACCVVLGHEADSTLGNALETAAWMRREGYHSLRLVTAAYHMRRSLLEFARVMPEMTIIAMKHQSAWDTVILPVIFDDPAIVIKHELAWLPIYGWYAVRAGGIPVDRGAGASALKRMLMRAKRAAASGRPIAIFPEGTRTAVGARLPYHPGVAALYTQLDLPLVPVAVNSGVFWSRRSFLKYPGRIVLEFLPAIPPGQQRRKVMSELETRIEAATARLVAEAQGTFPRCG